MLLNRVEYVLMNNPFRAAIQRGWEARRRLALGGPVKGGVALEIGCGRVVGVHVILDMFGASHVDAFAVAFAADCDIPREKRFGPVFFRNPTGAAHLNW